MLEKITYYKTESGRSPVAEFIEALEEHEKKKAAAYITKLEMLGHNLRRPVADYLDDGIYELRPKGNRIFFFFFFRNTAVLVHAIKKKSDKVPAGDLLLSITRKNEFIGKHGNGGI